MKLSNSRADYFKKRRETRKSFGALIDKNKLETFEKILEEREMSKKDWLEIKIEEEIKNSQK